MAAPSNAAAAYNNAGYESYYHQDSFWSGQPPVGYALPPLTDHGNSSTSTSTPNPSSAYEMPDTLQPMYYMPYYMQGMAAAAAYSDPSALTATAATSYAVPNALGTGPLGDASLSQHNFYMQQPPVPVPASQAMMGTPTYAIPVSMPNQISSPAGPYDYMGYGAAGPATGSMGPTAGMGVRTSSATRLPTTAAAPSPALNGVVKTTEFKQKKGGKKPKVEAPLSVRSHGDSEFDENDEEDPDRRKLNNIRERVRVRDINNAFHELGDMVSQFDQSVVPSERTQTKLGILHNAVELIKNLEEQVKRRNLARNVTAVGPSKPFPNL